MPAAAIAAVGATNEASPVIPTSMRQSSRSGSDRTPAAWQIACAVALAAAGIESTVTGADGMPRSVNVAVLSPGR